MRVATANIRNLPDMPRSWVREDAAGVKLIADVCGFQEIGEVEDHEDVATGLGSDWSLALGGLAAAGCDNPIGFDTREWRLVQTNRVLLHKGIAKVSLTRWLVWADLERVSRPGVVVRFGNVHFVANAWGRGDAAMPDHAVRVRTWEQDYAATEAFAAATAAEGLPLILVGDVNRRGYTPPAGGALAYGPGIEAITLHPAGGATFAVREVGDLAGHSDHKVRWARVRVNVPPVPHDCPVCGLSHFGPPATEV